MDRPSWTDTLRASLASCILSLLCFACSPSASHADSDDNYENATIPNGQYAIRRARADEIEGLLADSGEDAGYNPTDDRDITADADAISLHSHLGPRGRRRKPPPKKPRHISFFGFDLFGAGRRVKLSEEGAEPLHRGARETHRSDDTANGRRRSTEALLSNASPDAEALADVSEADVERRARRKARKEMRRLAAELAGQEASVVPPAPSPSAHGGIPAVFLPPSPAPSPDEDEEADADLDGGMYARLAPRSGTDGSRSSGLSSSSGSGSGVLPSSGGAGGWYAHPPFSLPQSLPKTKSKRSKKSKSSATSSTLASPPPSATAPGFSGAGLPQSTTYFKRAPAPSDEAEEFGAFTHAEEFDGTPGGFGVPPSFEREEEFDGAPGGLNSFDDAPVQREALPSPGLGRSRGFSTSGRRDNAFLAGF